MDGMMSMDGNTLVASMVFGTLGMGYFVYGKKTGKVSALLAGIALMVFPYVIPGLAAMIVTGIVLLAIPFVL